MTSKQAFAREEAVFKNRSMERMFPTKPETWHLSHIFEKTIRQNPSDRVQGTGQTLELIREVRYWSVPLDGCRRLGASATKNAPAVRPVRSTDV